MVDQVDVLNESLGGNPFPDVTAIDVVKQIQRRSSRCGCGGDRVERRCRCHQHAGPSAATDPKMLDVGASTVYRFNAQNNLWGCSKIFRDQWLAR